MKFFTKNENNWVMGYFPILLATSYAGIFAIPKWFSFFGSLLIVLCLTSSLIAFKSHLNFSRTEKIFYFLIFASPILAIIFPSIYHQGWDGRAFDGPLRILFAFSVFYLILVHKTQPALPVALGSAVALIAGLIALPANVACEQLNPNCLTEMPRVTPYWLNPIPFGFLSGILTGFSLIALLATQSVLSRMFLFLGFICGCVIIMLSGTRAAYLVLLLVFLISSFHLLRGMQSVGKVWLTAAFITCSLIAILTPHPWARIKDTTVDLNAIAAKSQEETSGTLRTFMWATSAKLFTERPIFGYGFDGGRSSRLSQYNDELHPVGLEFVIKYRPHNEFLTKAVDSGVFGIAAYLLLYFFPLVIFAKNYFRSRFNSVIDIMGLILVSSAIVSGMFSEFLTPMMTHTFYGISLATLLGTSIRESAQTEVTLR